MMKKTRFIVIFNLLKSLALLLFTIAVLSVSLKFIDAIWLKVDANFPFKSHILKGIELTSKITDISIIVLSILLICLILQEIIKRITNDNLINLAKSIIGTYQFRRFLKQHKIMLDSDTEITKSEETILSKFNNCVNKCVLDLSNKELKLFIKIPKESQVQRILKQHEEQIKEYIISLYPEYIISTFERKKFTLWLIGTKRK